MRVKDTARLHFRLLDKQDAELLFELDQDPAVMKHISGGVPTTWQEIQQRFMPRLAAYRNDQKGWGLWGCFLNDTDQYIGWVLVRPMDFFTDAPNYNDLELGWRFKQSAWGQGYGFEAAQAVANAVSQSSEVQFLSALAVPENSGSINIMKKLGMTYVNTFLDTGGKDPVDVVHYQMAASKFN